MAIFAWRLFKDFFSKPIVISFVSVLFCSLYGASDEWHQSFVPGRATDVMDWVADTAGAVMALTIIHFRRQTKK